MSMVGDILRIYVLVVGSLAILIGTTLGLWEITFGIGVEPVVVLLAMGIVYLVGSLLLYTVLMPGGYYILSAHYDPRAFHQYQLWTVDPVDEAPAPIDDEWSYERPFGGTERRGWQRPRNQDRERWRDAWSVERPYGPSARDRVPRWDPRPRRTRAPWPWTNGRGRAPPGPGPGRRGGPFRYAWEWHSSDERIPTNRWDLPEPRPLLYIFLFSIVAGTILLILGRSNPFLYLGFPAAFIIAFSFPSLMWISYTYTNQFDPEPRRAMLLALTWGMLATNIAILSEAVVPTTDIFLLVAVAAPVLEELAKPIGLIFLRKWIRTPLQGLVFGVTCGMGFAMVENLLYESYFVYTDITVGGIPIIWGYGSLARGLLSTLGHAVGTGLVGYAYGVYRREKLSGDLMESVGPIALIAGSLGLAIGLHSAWNASAYLAETVHIGLISIPMLVAAINFIILVRITRRARRHSRRIRAGRSRFSYSADVPR